MACSRSLNREVQAHNGAHYPRRSSVGHPHVSKNENDDRTAVSRAAVLACSDVPGGSAIAQLHAEYGRLRHGWLVRHEHWETPSWSVVAAHHLQTASRWGVGRRSAASGMESAVDLTVCPAHCVRTTTARCVAVIRPATLYLLVTQAA
jgi:hypothetical protein